MTRTSLGVLVLVATLFAQPALARSHSSPGRSGPPSRSSSPAPRRQAGPPARAWSPAPPPPARYVPSRPSYVPGTVYAAPVYAPAVAYAEPGYGYGPEAEVAEPVALPAPALHAYLGAGALGGVVGMPDGMSTASRAGGGFEAFAGIEVGRHAGLEFNWSGTFLGREDGTRASVHGGTVDAHFYLLGPQSVIRPYLSAGLGGFMMFPDRDAASYVPAFGLDAGAGVDVNLGHLLVGARVSWRGLYVDDAARMGGAVASHAFLNDVIGTVRVGLRF